MLILQDINCPCPTKNEGDFKRLKEDEENFHAKENSRLHSEVDALSVRLIDALNLLDVARNQIKKEEQKQ